MPGSSPRTPSPRIPRGSFASSPAARRRMQLVKRHDSAPELALRRSAHALGLRFYVHRCPLPGLRREADLVFPRSRVAVFVDGCFWHGCPDHGRREHRTNGWYWPDKIASNVGRDADTNARLADAGWAVVRVWEHEDAPLAARRVLAVVQARPR